MYKFIPSLLLVLCSTGSEARSRQESIDVYCSTTKEIFETLLNKYGEKIIITGQAPQGKKGVMSMWLNDNTGSWTITVTHSPEKSCIVGGGRDFNLRPPKTKQWTAL